MTNDVYVVDTSSWIELSRRHPVAARQAVWNGINTLVRQERIKAPWGVREEILQGSDDLCSWIMDRLQIFIAHDKELVRLATKINEEFPKMVNPNKV